jgi:hypothetical protein
LFRPALRQFLDGFIAALEAYSRQPRQEIPAVPPRIEPVVGARGHSEEIQREVPAAPAVEPVAERDAPRRVETPPPPPMMPPPTPAPPVIEVRPAPVPHPDGPASSPAPDVDFARTVGYPDGDRAIGVFRLSGWSLGGASPRASAPVPAPEPVSQPVEPVPPPAQRPPDVLWTNVLEQARTVGVVDLSAYDTLEYLSELRDIFDRRESLRNGVAAPEDPGAR